MYHMICIKLSRMGRLLLALESLCKSSFVVFFRCAVDKQMINMDSRLQNLWLHLLIFSMVTLGTTNSDNFVPTGLVLFVFLWCLQRKNMCAPVCAIFPSSPGTLFLRISTHFHPNLQGSCSSTCVYIQSTHRAEAWMLRHRSALLRAMLQLGALLPKEPYFPTSSLGFTWFKHPWSWTIIDDCSPLMIVWAGVWPETTMTFFLVARRNASRAACKCWRRVSCWTGWQCAAYARFFWEEYRCWDGVFWDYIINNIYIYLSISIYIWISPCK